MSALSLPILAAEDEETERFLLKIAFERTGLPNPLVTVGDGKEAVDYLAGHAPYTDRAIHPLPALLLLDLKMPRMNGFDVLAWLAARPEFRDLPVAVLSSSPDESDIARARQMGACAYFVKPHDLSDLVKIIQSLPDLWLKSTSAT